MSDLKKALFIDRDGTILVEPADEQIDALDKFAFVPGAISGLKALTGLGYELVLVSNQDGLGTSSFPEETFWPCQNLMLNTLKGEGIVFDNILIDKTFPHENAPTRKPGTGMLGSYMDGSYDLAASFVIGDRETDIKLAENLGARALQVGPMTWAEIAEAVRSSSRQVTIARKTRETDITLTLDLDGKGPSGISTGLHFFDHMLEQIPHHGGVSLAVSCQGDLEVDEHHTMEDATSEASIDMDSYFRWTSARQWYSLISEEGRISYGRWISPANTWAIPPRKCSRTSSSRYARRPAATSAWKPKARTTTTWPSPFSRPSPGPCAKPSGAMCSTAPSPHPKVRYDRHHRL